MRKLAIVSMVVAAAFAGGCKKDKKDGEGGGGGGSPSGGEAPAPAAKLVDLDASSAGEAYAGWHLQAPAGATAKEDFGALVVSDGAGFQLQVNTGAADFAASKKEIEANDVNKFKKYLTDSPDTLVYQSDLGMGPNPIQVHFLANVKIGGADYNCENVKGATTFTEAQTKVMVDSCKSITKK